MPGLDLLEGFNVKCLRPYVGAAGGLVLLWLLIALLLPGYVAAFASRACLTNAPYPTRTRIVEILSPAKVIRAGSEVRFSVRLAGELPDQATAEVRASGSRQSATVTLKPDEHDMMLYTGTMRVAQEAMTFRIFAGDASTQPQQVEVIPEAQLKLQARIMPPDYADVPQDKTVTESLRVEALEGSKIELVLTSDQPLREVSIEAGDQRMAMTPQATDYRLEKTGPPLSPLASSLTLRTHAIDKFGVPLENTPTMTISMRPDREPAVDASAVTRRVLPTATPKIRVEASDDLGLDRLVLRRLVVPVDGEPIEFRSDLVQLRGAQRVYLDTISLAVAEMALSPGDRLEVTIEAIDHRGALVGASAVSAPIVFEVVDKQMLLEGLLESDQRLDQRLDEVIDTQLEIGGQTP